MGKATSGQKTPTTHPGSGESHGQEPSSLSSTSGPAVLVPLPNKGLFPLQLFLTHLLQITPTAAHAHPPQTTDFTRRA